LLLAERPPDEERSCPTNFRTSITPPSCCFWTNMLLPWPWTGGNSGLRLHRQTSIGWTSGYRRSDQIRVFSKNAGFVPNSQTLIRDLTSALQKDVSPTHVDRSQRRSSIGACALVQLRSRPLSLRRLCPRPLHVQVRYTPVNQPDTSRFQDSIPLIVARDLLPALHVRDPLLCLAERGVDESLTVDRASFTPRVP